MQVNTFWALVDGKYVKREVKVSKPVKKKTNKKKVKPALKQYVLKWFVSGHGKSVEPSPMEDKIRTILNGYDIEFHTEVSFRGLNPSGKPNGYLRFDFYIPSKKIAIEYQGEAFHKRADVKRRDAGKVAFCKSNGIRLVVFDKTALPLMAETIHKLLVFGTEPVTRK